MSEMELSEGCAFGMKEGGSGAMVGQMAVATRQTQERSRERNIGKRLGEMRVFLYVFLLEKQERGDRKGTPMQLQAVRHTDFTLPPYLVLKLDPLASSVHLLPWMQAMKRTR
jgi:hypothetical protein